MRAKNLDYPSVFCELDCFLANLKKLLLLI